MHEDGCFYLYMEEGGPLVQMGNSMDGMFNGLLGEDTRDWEEIE